MICERLFPSIFRCRANSEEGVLLRFSPFTEERRQLLKPLNSHFATLFSGEFRRHELLQQPIYPEILLQLLDFKLPLMEMVVSRSLKSKGNGRRFRCVEIGHEVLAKDRDSYSRTKRCRLGLIDFALSHRKVPLNMFVQDPLF